MTVVCRPVCGGVRMVLVDGSHGHLESPPPPAPRGGGGRLGIKQAFGRDPQQGEEKSRPVQDLYWKTWYKETRGTGSGPSF